MKRLRYGLLLALAMLAPALLLCGCGAKRPEAGSAQVLVDGAVWNEAPTEDVSGALRVYVTLDGRPLIDLPFDEAHTVVVRQPDGGENEIALTGDAVYMRGANCENQDCVQMGAVTEDNLEIRVMGGFIVCLPHRLSVEVRR